MEARGLAERVLWFSGLWLLMVVGVSCRSVPSLPPADLSAPGWRLRQGQAVWKPAANKPELAGELLLATRTNGDFLIQFTKTPMSLAAAQFVGGRWQIEFGNHDYVRRGHGQPPARFVWFQLHHALAGAGLSSDWHIRHTATNAWKLENTRTGEMLEGYLSP
jgi:hypothetical protein